MSETGALIVWGALGAYALIGACVAAFALAIGFSRFDENAAAAPWRVKLMLAPGAIALWPIIVRRMAGAKPPEDRR